MPGYVINLGATPGRLELYAQSGIYGTSNLGRTGWFPQTLYTLADYLTMRPGDFIFFFRQRFIFGMGRIAAVGTGTSRACVLCNFQNSHLPTQPPTAPFLWDGDADHAIRWRVFFRPAPSFFHTGVDMDEVLQADAAGIARSLRVFARRSFVKLEDDETHLVATAILRRNISSATAAVPDDSASVHHQIELASTTGAFALDVDDLIRADRAGNQVRHEPTLQAWLVSQLAKAQRSMVTDIFGFWSFVANLYPASPLKPREYMDEIDIFGYTLVNPPAPLPSFVDRFKIIEVKTDAQTVGAGSNVVDQVMKYVDWISVSRAGQDYGLIDAFIVAHDFSPELIRYAAEHRTRPYVIPRRPYQTREWNSLSLIRYRASGGDPPISLTTVLPPG